ncbi:hypothetical protein [Dietzia cinnamea]|uniref:hypothetical protein n=1 Tax=Dietzia cinnamea TaxID=321318 RepID=UPI000AB7225C|nr:hypothetical protein [Dietzia cinnamea]MCT1638941.1 hypothetical protein [Dietzia cinnamea]MCT2097307.1 hypothetical protein [Dietzia cinnamea]
MSASADHIVGDRSEAESGGGRVNEGTRLTRATAWLVFPPSLLLAPLSGFLLYMVHATGSDQPWHVWNLLWTAFDIGAEGNAAVWFASAVWLLVGAFAALAAVTTARFRSSWWLFSAVAVTASVDEAGALHERLFVVGDRLAPYLPFDTYYNWVIPGAVIALIVGGLLIRLVLALHRRVAVSLIAAAVVFLSGSLVIESLTGLVDREIGASSTLYLTLMYIEETFELLGVAGAAVALSSMFRVARRPGGLLLTFDGFRSRDA